MSSMNFPRNLIEKEWFKWIATVNPLSYLVEGVRGLLIYRWDLQALGLGFAVAIGILLLGLFGSVQALKTRLVRT
jgi:ABC-2 type transport system permease protein